MTKSKTEDDTQWLTLQQVRNLVGLNKIELNALLGRIGHVREEGEGTRKKIHLPSFFRAWHDAEQPVEDEHDRRRRVALAERAENLAELSRLELQKQRGELIPESDVDALLRDIGWRYRQMAEDIELIDLEAYQIVLDFIERLAKDYKATATTTRQGQTSQNGRAKQ